MAQELQDKAMLVKLSISQWTAKKLDKKVTAEVARNYGTDEDRGRYNKVLIAKGELDKITKAVSAARAFHYANTLPWGDDGSRILPSANYLAYAQAMAKLRNDFDLAVETFVANYPDLVDQARRELNGLFRVEDYPSYSRIKAKFSFQVGIDPIPSAADFRVQLQDADVERIRQDIQTRAEAAQQDAVQDLWNRLHDVVSRMAERLGTPYAIFRDSLVGNVSELCDLLPRLNLTGDPQLETMRREVADKLTKHDPQTLRDNQYARKDTAKAAEDILTAMAGYVKAA